MNEKATPSDEWIDCPPGTLNQVVQHTARRRRADTMIKAAVIGTVSCVVVLAYSLLFTENPSQPMRYGNLTCQQVQEQMDDYRAGRVSQELAQQIENHLAMCESCKEGMAEQESGRTKLVANDRCACPYCSSLDNTRGLAAALRPERGAVGAL